MTNTPLRSIDSINDADATRIMLAAITDATNEIRDTMQYWGDRFDWISDYDDYIPAAARILTAITEQFLSHTDDTPCDALRALLDNTEFVEDMQIADFSTELHDFIPDFD